MRRAFAAGLVIMGLSLAACQDEVAPPEAPAAASSDGHAGGAHGAMAPMDPDPSRNFALQMIEHHQGAVVMSQAALQDELDPEMRALAQKIIGDQEREIAQMRAFLARSRPAE